jgi:hypothetical protein
MLGQTICVGRKNLRVCNDFEPYLRSSERTPFVEVASTRLWFCPLSVCYLLSTTEPFIAFISKSIIRDCRISCCETKRIVVFDDGAVMHRNASD